MASNESSNKWTRSRKYTPPSKAPPANTRWRSSTASAATQQLPDCIVDHLAKVSGAKLTKEAQRVRTRAYSDNNQHAEYMRLRFVDDQEALAYFLAYWKLGFNYPEALEENYDMKLCICRRVRWTSKKREIQVENFTPNADKTDSYPIGLELKIPIDLPLLVPESTESSWRQKFARDDYNFIIADQRSRPVIKNKSDANTLIVLNYLWVPMPASRNKSLPVVRAKLMVNFHFPSVQYLPQAEYDERVARGEANTLAHMVDWGIRALETEVHDCWSNLKDQIWLFDDSTVDINVLRDNFVSLVAARPRGRVNEFAIAAGKARAPTSKLNELANAAEGDVGNGELEEAQDILRAPPVAPPAPPKDRQEAFKFCWD